MNNTATSPTPDRAAMAQSPGGRILASILASLSSRIRYAS